MSFANQRPSSSSGISQASQQSRPQPSAGVGMHSNSADSNVSQPHQSPLDWSNYTYLSNTPDESASSQNANFRSSSGPYGDARVQQQQQDGAYQAYPQNSGQNRAQQNYGYPTGPSPQSRPGQQYPSSLHVPQALHARSNESQVHSGSKGKSPANRPSSAQALENLSSNSHADDTRADNGLSLDPSAFSRDIRFQVPQFLSNQMGGAPTFPPGGEAWSGFLGSSFNADSNSAMTAPNLTPGSMFNNIFGLAATPDSNQYSSSTPAADGSDNRNVLQGLSGFMDGDGGWSDWNIDTGKPDSGQAQPTTFYVNPNPSPNTLAQARSAPTQNGQSQQQQQQQVSRSQSQKMSLDTSVAGPSGPQSARTVPSPRNTAFASSVQSPQTSSSVPTSAILPPVNAFHNSLQRPDGLPYVPSMSAPTGPTHGINIASSSTAPYAPPSNTEQLLSGPSLPSSFGPSLSDGPGLYSTTGFDMVGVLARVANRKDPKTVLGPVDLSCSFVVVDIRRYDSPIVYASPTFMSLTGFDLPSILGRNCRFLQAPDGEVVKGSKRKYTDNVAVAHLKRMLNAGKECQASLINYRRGGVPFINLVTVVPIPWEGTDVVYHVGFQVDLVEQPNAILRNMRDGSYQVNYTVTNPPQPPLRPPTGRELTLGLHPDIVEILGNRVNQPGFGQGDDGGKSEWLKMVLENSDDFIHVLSLKGLFQYVSPSVRRVLEYEPEELMNKNIADICHPSDIVPLMRELKDSTHAPTEGQTPRNVTLVFRIRRKNSGYVWIESIGRLHVEAGKGRKAVILSGRAKSVPTLPWENVSRNGGLADTEFWAKVSFQGLILHATDSVAQVLGLRPDEIAGQSLYSFLLGGDNGPPSQAQISANPDAASSKLSEALSSIVKSEIRHGGLLLQHRMISKSGKPVEVDIVIYTPRSIATISRTPSDEEGSSSSPSSDSSHPTSTASNTIAGIQPDSLVVQIKQRSPVNSENKPIVHNGAANVFEELETTRGTSWQYELHQLRLLNRRLKEDIQTSKTALAKNGANGKKKRKQEDSAGGTGAGLNGNGGGMAPPPVPELMTVAPRHQMAPGFGLVPPGTSSPYF